MLIALDGIDGAGKSTQQALLAERLRRDRHWTVASRNLGSTPRFREVLASLKGGALSASPPIRELVYYFEGVFASLELAQRPEFDAVIADRYYLTYRSYGQLNGWTRDDILFFTKHLPRPDVHVVLDLPPALAAERIERERDFHEPELGYQPVATASRRVRFMEYQTRVRELMLSDAPSAATVLDASAPEAALADRIAELVSTALERRRDPDCVAP